MCAVEHNSLSTRRAVKMLGAALAGYAAGSFPSAELAQRLSRSRVDLRTDGSGNPGATNVDKLLGHGWGAAVLVTDVAKGALAAKTGGRIGGGVGANIAGTSAVLGHCFRRFGRRRGGKGVATRYGQLLITDPRYLVVDFLVAFGVGRLTKRGAIALSAAVATSAVAALSGFGGRERPFGLRRVSSATAIATLSSGALVLVRFFQERGRPDELRPVQQGLGRSVRAVADRLVHRRRRMTSGSTEVVVRAV